MGFSGGGSNVLKPHTHDGTVAQDGGALDMNGVTQGSLTSGDIVYSDGSNLQRLAIGSSNDQLTVSGSNLPTWTTPAPPAGSNYEFLGTSSVSAGTTLTVSFSAVQPPDYVIGVFNGSVTSGQGIDIVRVNGITTNTYIQNGQDIQGGSATVHSPTNQSGWYGCLSSISGTDFICTIEAHANGQDERIYSFINATSNKPGSFYGYGYNSTTGQTGIDEITFTSGSNFTGNLDVWAIRN
jgi:hypothetical protein